MTKKLLIGIWVLVVICIFGTKLFIHLKINEPKEEHPRCLSALFECDKQRKHLRELNAAFAKHEQRWKKRWEKRWTSCNREAKAWKKQAAQCINKKIGIKDNK